MSIKMSASREKNIRDDVHYNVTPYKHSYTYEYNSSHHSHPISYLSEAVRNLGYFAKYDNIDDIKSNLVYSERRFRYLFHSICKDNVNETLDMPTVYQIFSNLGFYYHDTDFNPRTITIQKFDNKLNLKYEVGFNATDQKINLTEDTIDIEKYHSVRFCGRGIKEVHHPYNPKFTESWRKSNSSKISISYKKTQDGLMLGLDTSRPDYPMWYGILKPILKLNPYSKDTFDLDEQTPFVDYRISELESS